MNWKIALMAALLGLIWIAPALAETIVSIDRIRENDLEMVGFDLPRDADVKIEAVGLRGIPSRRLYVYAWLIDHETRKPIWVMKSSGCERYENSRTLRLAQKEMQLPKGQYELYLYAGDNASFNIDDLNMGVSRTLHRVFGTNDKGSRRNRSKIRDCYVKIEAAGLAQDDIAEVKIDGAIRNAFVQFNRVRDDKVLSQAFELTDNMSLRLYAFAEIPDRGEPAVDAGWIINTETRERVWEMTWRNTKPAGGGKKNRKFNHDIELDKGKYVVYYATDDSHSWAGFNTAPPLDPSNWGLSLLPAKGTDASDFRLLEAIKESESLIDITRVRDDDYHEKSFKLTKPGTVQILAIGEYSKSDRQFVDSGWITDLDSGRKVWEMTKRNTQHAGGDEKNRMFDGLVDLPEGSYQVCYSSDDSHAYRSWNTAAPFQPKSWGLTIIPGPDFDKGSFSLLTGDMAVQSPNCLVQIVRVRNREHQRDTFVLDTETEIHIYAIGEWDEIYDEFADYGWIEDSRGHTVWEMTRRNTRFAGGARKNRRFDDSLVLEAGEYEVHFRTDDSHAFNQWNAERPRDPRNWGITIRTADN